VRPSCVRFSKLLAITLIETLFVALIGCGGAQQRPTFATATDRPVCLVLSVGEAKGLAHIGAIKAAKDAGLDIRCVVGNSMGALIGSMYATAPDEDVRERYRAYINAYAEETKQAIGEGILLSLFGIVLAPVTGGTSLALTVGGAIAADQAAELNHERAVKVLNAFYNDIAIEDLEIAFATFHSELKANDMTPSTKGNLADAVGKSIANPLVFPGFDEKKSGYVDPGLDRVARTPIDDACKLFPKSRILAVNVTGHPAYYANDLPCPVLDSPLAIF
jgi:predicted acylesterase/phospholipase RssA